MKKTVIIALAGIIMLAFTQCGGSVQGSKEYQDALKHFKKVGDMVAKAKTCADLDSVTEFFYGYEAPEYAEGDRLTEAENKLLVKEIRRIDSIFNEKQDRLCD